MKTLKQEREDEWKKFESVDITKQTAWHEESHGRKAPVIGKWIRFNVDEFICHSGCNVFHWDDVAKALYSIRYPFSLFHWEIEGRTRYFQMTANNRYRINIRACGYGTGDYIEFSPGFPKDSIFRILRELTIDNSNDMIRYYKSMTRVMDTKESLKMWNALLEVYYNDVTSIEEMKQLAEYFGLKMNIKCTKSLIRHKPDTFLTKEKLDRWRKELPKAEARFKELEGMKIIKDYKREENGKSKTRGMVPKRAGKRKE